MPNKVKKLEAKTGADVEKEVQKYLDKKNLSRYIQFNYVGLQRLKGPVKIEIALKWTASVGGTVTITAKGSDGAKMTPSKTTVLIPPDSNADEVQDALREAGLWG